MSDDTPEVVAPVLRREALLPNERNKGLGTVAVVCTMAGVASGLALATTLMAMQVADTMSTRNCPYRSEVMVPSNQGFLGIRYVFTDGVAQVHSVISGTPADKAGIHKGDRVVSINGDLIDSALELQQTIRGASPGSRPSIKLEREGASREVRPTLTSWPSARYARYAAF